MHTAWIYQLHKPELVKEAEERGIATEGLTVEQIRKLLVELLRAPEEYKTPDKPRPATMEDEQDRGKPDRLNRLVREWNLSFRSTDNPVEFIERLEELIAAGGIDNEDVLPALPRILQGKALLWYRNNADSWRSWDQFLELFKLYYFPTNYEEDLIVKIVARKQRFRESFTDYLTDLQTLMRRYGNMAEKEKLHRIHENMQKEYKLYIKKNEYKDLNGLVKLAAEYESITASPDHRDRHSNNGGYASSIYERPQEDGNPAKPRTQYNAPEQPSGSGEPGNGVITKIHPRYNATTCCWSCGKPGHNRQECRSPKRLFCSGCGRLGMLSRNCCKSRVRQQSGSLGTAGNHHRNDNRIYENARISGNYYTCLIDTGSTNTYINKEVYEACKQQGVPAKQTQIGVVLADDTNASVNTCMLIDMEIRGTAIKHCVRVLPSATHTIIGMDVLNRMGVTVTWPTEAHAPIDAIENDQQPPHKPREEADPVPTHHRHAQVERNRVADVLSRNSSCATARQQCFNMEWKQIDKGTETPQGYRIKNGNTYKTSPDNNRNKYKPSQHNRSTRYTPAFQLHGRELRNPNDRNPFPTPRLNGIAALEDIHATVRQNKKNPSITQKYYHDKRRRHWEPTPGEMVLNRNYVLSNAEKNRCAKLMPRFI